MKKLLRKLAHLIVFSIAKILPARLKTFIKNLFSPEQKYFIRRLLSPGHGNTERIRHLRIRLLSLGFTDRALNDLQTLASDRLTNFHIRKEAACELALWHANQHSKSDAKQSLAYLSSARQNEYDPHKIRQIAIMEAECHQLLDNYDLAKIALEKAMSDQTDGDLFLAAANLELETSKRILWINKALALHGIKSISYDPSTDLPFYDSLQAEPEGSANAFDQAPLVSIIIPAYNSEKVIRTAIDSLLIQTWGNLELLVVDDCSTDNTAAIVKEYTKKDKRVHLLKAAKNGGPYVARNLALKKATGTFVTCHDADDWSHPEKIEIQACHLLQNPSVLANTSQQARATSNLQFYRRGNFGYYTFNNLSSCMFRREPIMQTLGFWDSVRFGADGEFIRRLKKVFGTDSFVELSTGPLSFQRQSANSLTGNTAFGYHGYFMGARKDYFESQNYYHSIANTKELHYEFPQNSRPFAVPEPLKPQRETRKSGRRHFDIIIASEFRLHGGTNMSNLEEIKVHKQLGLRTGLIQISRYDLNAERTFNPLVRKVIDGDQVQFLVYGEKVACDLLLVRHPLILQDRQCHIPDLEADHIKVIVNQTPKKNYGSDGWVCYEIERCALNLKEYFGKDGIWHPIGPLVRDALNQHHAEELSAINLAEEDWLNIIDVNTWRCKTRSPRGPVPRIGRHSRDDPFKWPANKTDLLAVYPSTGKYEVHILGGAEAPERMLGKLPNNWHILEFGAVTPVSFLANLDVFVYYTHPQLVESFGRVIIEAMAARVPVILPPVYKKLFQDAAIYCEPAEVQTAIDQLMADDKYYQTQVEKALFMVEANFSHQRHAERISKFLTRKPLKNSVGDN